MEEKEISIKVSDIAAILKAARTECSEAERHGMFLAFQMLLPKAEFIAAVELSQK